MRKNESAKDIVLFNKLNGEGFINDREVKKTSNTIIQSILDRSSKKGTGNRGEPDLIYVNENKKILILIENKDSIKDHASERRDKPKNYAVDGIIHYLSFFSKGSVENTSPSTVKYIEDYKVIGLAVSGDIEDQYSHLIDTFIIDDEGNVSDIGVRELLWEEDYQTYFENIDLEKISLEISNSSQNINELLRSLDSQNRPILISALMICLYSKNGFRNDFKDNFGKFDVETIIQNIPIQVERVLKNEGISNDKIDVLTSKLGFIKTEKYFRDSSILQEILIDLDENVIPLFDRKSNYDIIGKFYEEFLRYAGITNVKNGIVLTPNHITKLFTDLVPLKTDDVIFDSCCGTGAFLIAGMNAIIDLIDNSELSDKKERKNKLKENQLIGIEYSSSMYILAISNMLFRGDGKSRIFHEDFFSKESEQILDGLKDDRGNKIYPTIGFINPPYGGQDNKKKPTKKEIQFIERTLDVVSRYCVVIAPLSTFFKDEGVRNRILAKHTLKCVINMPNDLFEPNASTHTAIAVFECNTPHLDKEVLLYDITDDGFVLSKQKGRTDVLNKRSKIKKNLLNKIANPVSLNGINELRTKISKGDERIIQAHSKTNYDQLTRDNFIQTIKEYITFKTKFKLGILGESIDEFTFAEILRDNNILNSHSIIAKDISLNSVEHSEIDLYPVFFNIRGSKESYTKHSVREGEYLYLTTSNKNNGIAGTSDVFTEKGNVITFDSATEGKCFYQDMNFIGSDHLEIIEPNENYGKLNLFIGLYVITILNMEMFRYSFGRKRAQKRMKKGKFYLPIDSKGAPNWDFMEKFIKSLPYSSCL